MDYIDAIRSTLGMKADKGSFLYSKEIMPDTYADVDDLVKEFDYKPATSVKLGVKNFVEWYKTYNNL